MSSVALDAFHLLASATASSSGDGWLSRNSTLVVGVVGIVISGFVGPTVTAYFTGRHERAKDARALAVARQEDLRNVLDEAAQVLSGAIGQLRPLLAAAQIDEELPKEPADFLRTLAPLGHRLRLRLPEDDPVGKSYDTAVETLRAVGRATASQAAFDAAVRDFDAARDNFLADSRTKLGADLFEDKTASKASRRR